MLNLYCFNDSDQDVAQLNGKGLIQYENVDSPVYEFPLLRNDGRSTVSSL